MRMYNRFTRVTIAGKPYSYPELDIEFDIPKTLNSNPDVAEITIWNLSDASIGAIMNDADIIVDAGYERHHGVIFEGKVERVIPEWQNVDKRVTILATNLGGGFRYKEVEKTYKGKTVGFMIRDLVNLLGIRVGEISVAYNKSFSEYSVNGNIYTNIKQLSAIGKSKVFTRNGKIFIRPYDQSGQSGVVLNATSGLIGSPVREEREEREGDVTKKVVEYSMKSLLNHQVDQDTWVQVDSGPLKGKFRVIEVKHTKDFMTEILVRP